MHSVIAVVNVTFILAIVTWSFVQQEHSLRKFFWPAFLARVGGGVLLGLMYTWYYPTGDTFAYFADGSQLAALAQKDFQSYLELFFFNEHLDDAGVMMLQPRALFLSKITSLVNLLTADNYWIAATYFSLVSFGGAWVLVKEINRRFPTLLYPAVIAFLFLPSVVFWTGGLLKEAPAMGAFWFLSALFLKIWFRDRLTAWQYAMAILSMWIFWNLKYYYAGIFVAVAAATFLCRFILRRAVTSAVAEAVLWIIILLLPVALVSLAHPNFHFDRLMQVIVENNAAYSQMSAAGDFIAFDHLVPEAGSLALNAPLALFSGLFRPVIHEASGVTQILASIENAVLFVLFAGAVARARSYLTSPHRLLILCLIAFVVISAILIALSAPNFGTLSRFRCGYISFFSFIILCNNPLLQYVERAFRLVRH
ncbi:MAG: hypothetical protein M3Y60_07480 [Bacteroidota bacterium]|nr:hypothetical protein [Bacteroidota bacterium]